MHKFLVFALILSIVSPADTMWAAQSATSTKSSSSSAKKKTTPSKTSAKTASKKKTTAKSRKKPKVHVNPARLRRMKRAFVASSDLKPMALQLIDLRSKPAYAGVEAYARKHPASDAGALAWLAIGYAHVLDKEYPQAEDALKKAQPHAGELADYVRYLLALSYGGQGKAEQVVATLKN